jgi:hypothetical protein
MCHAARPLGKRRVGAASRRGAQLAARDVSSSQLAATYGNMRFNYTRTKDMTRYHSFCCNVAALKLCLQDVVTKQSAHAHQQQRQVQQRLKPSNADRQQYRFLE